MKRFQTFENYERDSYTPLTIDGVVRSFTAKYGGEGFFSEFIKEFPTKDDFNEELWDYFDEDSYDEDYDEDLPENDLPEDEDDFDEFGELWSPEAEVQCIKDNISAPYPGDEIWTDFFNALVEAGW